MMIAINSGDLWMKYAKNMEFLERVQDGREKEIGKGNPLLKAMAPDIESKRVIPLYCEAYSDSAEGFRSKNAQVLKVI
jgi:hypothetical protein